MNTQKSIDRELIDWAFAELRKQFRYQACKYDNLTLAAMHIDDTVGIEQFTAAATAWKQAIDRIIDIDIRVMIKCDELENIQEDEGNLGNQA